MLLRTVYFLFFLLLWFSMEVKSQTKLELVSLENDSAVNYYPQRTHHYIVKNQDDISFDDSLMVVLSFPFPWTVITLWDDVGVYHVRDVPKDTPWNYGRKYRISHLNWGVGHPYWANCNSCPMEHPNSPVTMSLKGFMERKPLGEWGIAVVEWGPQK